MRLLVLPPARPAVVAVLDPFFSMNKSSGVNSRSSRLFLAVWLLTVIFRPAFAAEATTKSREADLIRQELQALKAEHERRMRALEERLQQLEATTQPPAPAVEPAPAVASAVAPAIPPPAPAQNAGTPPEAVAKPKREFQSDTETREWALLQEGHPYAERVEQVLGGFVDIKAYLRAGFGRNSEGGPQVGFQAPGSQAKYRLGNEAETYAEITIAKDFYPADSFKVGAVGEKSTGPVAHVQATISMFNPYQEALSSSATDFGLPELWGSVGNVFAAHPEVKFWAGNRFYRRHDIHVNDFFFSNMSGGGGGVEDIPLAFGKLALAWVGAGSTSGVSSVPEPDAANKAGLSKSNWDLRLYDVPVPGGKGELGLVYARTSSGLDAAGNSAPDSHGLSFLFVHTRDGVFSPDGMNKASIQFGTGAAKTLNAGFETFTLNGGSFIRPDEDDSWRVRFTEQLIANINDSFSISPIFVYQYTDYALANEKIQWISAGVRPIWHFNHRVSLAAEFGADWVDNDATGTSDALYKFTLAPQVSLGGRFMSRPAIRAFFTYATWGDDFVGQVGGLDFQNESEGFTYGVQVEAWW